MKLNNNSKIYTFCEKNKYFKWIFLFLFILTIGIHFLLSLQNANKSSELSSSVTEQIVEVVEEITGEQINTENAHTIVRKLIGHFMWFSLIGLFGYLTVFSFFGNKYIVCMITNLILGIIIAMISELLQSFSEGRSCEIKDMLIDYSGFIVFELIFVIIHLFFLKNEKNRV